MIDAPFVVTGEIGTERPPLTRKERRELLDALETAEDEIRVREARAMEQVQEARYAFSRLVNAAHARGLTYTDIAKHIERSKVYVSLAARLAAEEDSL